MNNTPIHLGYRYASPLFSTQHSALSTQHPAPSSQLPAPSSQLPAPSSQLPAPSSQLPAPSFSSTKGGIDQVHVGLTGLRYRSY
ncbi:hypothetical protein BJ878DRAFT_270880 [Calycina marina]|uniref:Uncharacterized protein n=1 Tax=Calycina marina TaxID=1763456 RepID=A0A9P8CBN8_9HELO|nr:hypothetical protein BJ878DRAFT_270880 [Calycina marina]